MGKKKDETTEATKSPIAKKTGANGLGIAESIVATLKKSKKKGGMSTVEVVEALKKNFDGADKSSTVQVQLGAKAPCKCAITSGVIIEVIDGETAKDRRYKFAGEATEEQIAEWKAEVKAATAARKAAKLAKEAGTTEEAGTTGGSEAPEMTKKEKKAAKKAAKEAATAAGGEEEETPVPHTEEPPVQTKEQKKAAKKAKKAAKKAGKK